MSAIMPAGMMAHPVAGMPTLPVDGPLMEAMGGLSLYGAIGNGVATNDGGRDGGAVDTHSGVGAGTMSMKSKGDSVSPLSHGVSVRAAEA